MDRRDFLQVLLFSSVLPPLLRAGESSGGSEIYLLSDRPDFFLPRLLEAMASKDRGFRPGAFSLASHPLGPSLKKALVRHGWRPGHAAPGPVLRVDFRPLRRPAPPSFTLVREGRIQDIRNAGLQGLWKALSADQSLSSCLTVASYREAPSGPPAGSWTQVFVDGRLADRLSLEKDIRKRYSTPRGSILLDIAEGKTRILQASCPQKICCAAHPISRSGERIVCAPGRFLIEVQGEIGVDTVIG